MFHTLISYIENTFDTLIYWKIQNMCEVRSFIGVYFICQHIYLYVKHVFNAWYLCVKCMNLWMNVLHTTFIINSSHVKFVMNVTKILEVGFCCCHNIQIIMHIYHQSFVLYKNSSGNRQHGHPFSFYIME